MKCRHLSILAVVMLLLSLSVVACGDEAGDITVEEEGTTSGTTVTSAGDGTTDTVPDPGGAAWIGVWRVVSEDGRTPAENGYNSLTLTLAADAFTSEYDSDAATCTWSGTHTSTATSLTLITDAATGPPCDLAVGKTKTAQLTLSADGNTLTLDWTAEPIGALQVYERIS